MKIKSYRIIFSALITFLLSCHSKHGTNHRNKKVPIQKIKDSSQVKETDIQNITKTLDLTEGFKVEARRGEDFGNFTTFSLFQLLKNNKTIYTDSSIEYEFGDTLYPMVLKTENNSYELLFEVNDRPNKNYLKRLYINDNIVVKKDSLPTFISKPYNVNGNGLLKCAGFWDYNQTTDSFTNYNPILYFTLTPSGLKLDSELTKEKNTFIYGQFLGYEMNAKEIPKRVLKKYYNEVEGIRTIKQS